MADVVKTNDSAAKPATPGEQPDWQSEGQARAKPPVESQTVSYPLHPVEITPEAAAVKPADLKTIRDADSFRANVSALVKEARAGKPVSFDIDVRVAMTDKKGQPIKDTQASILYDELKKAYPDNAFVFSKPDLKPGDKGYSEIPAPEVTNPEGVRLSSKENQITTSQEIALNDGTKLPAGSKFAVGTIFDGTTVKSADPNGKVWAQTPGGEMIKVADAGERAPISKDVLSPDPKHMGQIAKNGDHLIVRTAADTDPDGKPLLDVYPNNAEKFRQNYKPGTTTDMWAVKAKSVDHLLLPSNIIVEV